MMKKMGMFSKGIVFILLIVSLGYAGLFYDKETSYSFSAPMTPIWFDRLPYPPETVYLEAFSGDGRIADNLKLKLQNLIANTEQYSVQMDPSVADIVIRADVTNYNETEQEEPVSFEIEDVYVTAKDITRIVSATVYFTITSRNGEVLWSKKENFKKTNMVRKDLEAIGGQTEGEEFLAEIVGKAGHLLGQTFLSGLGLTEGVDLVEKSVSELRVELVDDAANYFYWKLVSCARKYAVTKTFKKGGELVRTSVPEEVGVVPVVVKASAEEKMQAQRQMGAQGMEPQDGIVGGDYETTPGGYQDEPSRAIHDQPLPGMHDQEAGYSAGGQQEAPLEEPESQESQSQTRTAAILAQIPYAQAQWSPHSTSHSQTQLLSQGTPQDVGYQSILTRKPFSNHYTVHFEPRNTHVDHYFDYSVLDIVVNRLKRDPDARVQLVAHTDNATDGRYNHSLAGARGAAVMNLLVQKGIDYNRIEITNVADSRPRGDSRCEFGRYQNRCVEIIILDSEGR